MSQNVPRVVELHGHAPQDCPQSSGLLKWFHDFKTMPQSSEVSPHQNLSVYVCRMRDRSTKSAHLKWADSLMHLSATLKECRSINCDQEVSPRKEPLMADRNVSFVLSKRILIGSQRRRRP
jgi:hypothetical protein